MGNKQLAFTNVPSIKEILNIPPFGRLEFVNVYLLLNFLLVFLISAAGLILLIPFESTSIIRRYFIFTLFNTCIYIHPFGKKCSTSFPSIYTITGIHAYIKATLFID